MTAEELAETFITAACEAKAVYHDRRWIITGTVVTNDLDRSGAARTFLAGRTGSFLDEGDCLSVEEWLPKGESTQDVRLYWDDAEQQLPEIGVTVRAVCRIRLHGLGSTLTLPSISGGDCRPE